MAFVNLSPGRLAVLVALVVGGIAVMTNGFLDDGATMAAGPSDVVETTTSGSPEPTDGASTSVSETPPPDLEPQVEGVSIQVLNGTNETGLASEVDLLLTGKGYKQGLVPDDLVSKPVPGTTVYFRTGDGAEQNEVDAENLATYLKRVETSVRPLNDSLGTVVPAKVDLVVVLGEDYAAAHPVT